MMVYPVGVTEYCEKILHYREYVTLLNMLQILSIFMDVKSSTSVIFVPNLKKSKPEKTVS